MSVEAITVRESQEIDDRIKNICLNYMQLMLECCRDKHKRDSFLKNPRSFLNYIGMVIPEGVPILLEVGLNFPALHIKTPEGKIAIYEGKLSIEVMHDIKDYEIENKKVTLKDMGEIDIRINEALSDPDVEAVVVMPFFDLYSGVVGVVRE